MMNKDDADDVLLQSESLMRKNDIMSFTSDIMFAFCNMENLNGRKAITKCDSRSKNHFGEPFIQKGETVTIVMPVPVDFGEGETHGLEVINLKGMSDVFRKEDLHILPGVK